MKVMMCKYIVLLVLLLSGCTSDTPGPDYDMKGDNAHAELQDSAEHITEPDELRNDVDAVTHQRSQSGILKWILIGIVVLSLSALVYIIVRNVQDKINEPHHRLKELERTIYNAEARNRRVEEQVKEQRRMIKELQDHLRSFKFTIRQDLDKIATSHEKTHIVSDSAGFGTRIHDIDSEVNTVPEKAKRPIKRKHFKVPDNSGRFDQNKGEDASEGRVYYWIEYQEGSPNGELNYNHGFLDKSAIDQRDSILRPVCEILNPDFFKPNSIRQMKPGKVELIDGYWVVREKVQIEFN